MKNIIYKISSIYFSNFIIFYFFFKKKGLDRTVPTRRGPAPGGQRWHGFNFFEFRPSRTVPYEPCGTVDRPDPWTARV
jgi:hypothetical protein